MWICDMRDQIFKTQVVSLIRETWFLVCIYSFTDSLASRLQRKEPDNVSALCDCLSCQLLDLPCGKLNSLLLQLRSPLSFPAMRLSCERTNHLLAHSSRAPLGLQITQLAPARAWAHIRICSHSRLSDWLKAKYLSYLSVKLTRARKKNQLSPLLVWLAMEVGSVPSSPQQLAERNKSH